MQDFAAMGPSSAPESGDTTVATLADLATRDRDFWSRLGFRDADLDDVIALAARVADDGAVTARVAELAAALRDRVGGFVAAGGPYGQGSLFTSDDERLEVAGVEVMGAVPILALAAAAEPVRAYHRSRGVDDELSWRALSDLGQQVWVHRRTFGGFGLHTQGWLTTAWSGALYWLGRLQFDLETFDDDGGAPRWVLSTHIPAAGPLRPDEVDASFAQARRFFGAHFADLPAAEFYCSSWLLDPRLARLGSGSNAAAFQARWSLVGEGREADGDAWFFVFQKRGEVDPTQLPRDSSLRRLILDEVAAGRSWRLRQGLIGSRA